MTYIIMYSIMPEEILHSNFSIDRQNMRCAGLTRDYRQSPKHVTSHLLLLLLPSYIHVRLDFYNNKSIEDLLYLKGITVISG